MGIIKRDFGDQVDVPKDRQFVGFDAYQKAMDCLKPGDIAIFATPLAFRWVHFTYAIQKGLNVFMEKPLTADGPTSRKMFELAEEATAKNLKVGVGLMSRHSRAMQQLAERIHGGEIGDLILLRGYRMHGPGGSMQSPPKPADMPEVAYQIRRFHSFLWASGGCFSDFYIHVIDHCCWMKNAWPVQAQALGGRHYRGDYVDQNFDTYSVEYTFPDETKFIMDGRCMPGCRTIYNSFAHGTKGTAIISRSGDCGGPSATFKGLGSSRANMLWQSKVKGERGQSLPERMERPGRRHPQRQALQRGETGRRGQPGDLDGTHGRAHRPDHHLRPDAQRQPRVRAERRQARHGRPRAAAGRRQRQVSRAATGHRHRPRVCVTGLGAIHGQIRAW